MSNINIRIDEDVKKQAEKVFSELGLNMTTAINIFLKQSIREQRLPFELKLDNINSLTSLAIEEGKKIANDKNVKGYNNINWLKRALDIWN